MGFVGHCKQSGTHQRRLIMKMVNNDIGNRLNGGQGQNKIGGTYLHHVDIAMHVR